MRRHFSTIVIALVAIAYAIYIPLKFTGVVGNDAGEFPAGMILMLLLVLGLLVLDIRRSHGSSGGEH